MVDLMGKIISEDATNIFFPQTCDVLVDDIRQITIFDLHRGFAGLDYKARAYRAECFHSDKKIVVAERV